MNDLLAVFMAICVGYGTAADVEREGRILIQDNYYTLVSKLESQGSELAALKTQVQTQDTNKQAEIDQLKAELATLKSQQAVEPHRVAFNAHLAKPFNPGQNQLIVFDDVRLNVGQAYHHGTFVAPYNGTYLFAVTMCSHSGHYISVELLRNGKMIGQVLAGDTAYDACSSETTVVELSSGDDVIVQHHGISGDYVHGSSYEHNSFTGVLLY